MLIEKDEPPEVQFGTLAPGDVFTDRSEKPHVKILKQEVFAEGNDDPKYRHNVLTLDPRPWTTWIDDGAYVRYHPGAVLHLGAPAAKAKP